MKLSSPLGECRLAGASPRAASVGLPGLAGFLLCPEPLMNIWWIRSARCLVIFCSLLYLRRACRVAAGSCSGESHQRITRGTSCCRAEGRSWPLGRFETHLLAPHHTHGGERTQTHPDPPSTPSQALPGCSRPQNSGGRDLKAPPWKLQEPQRFSCGVKSWVVGRIGPDTPQEGLVGPGEPPPLQPGEPGTNRDGICGQEMLSPSQSSNVSSKSFEFGIRDWKSPLLQTPALDLHSAEERKTKEPRGQTQRRFSCGINWDGATRRWVTPTRAEPSAALPPPPTPTNPTGRRRNRPTSLLPGTGTGGSFQPTAPSSKTSPKAPRAAWLHQAQSPAGGNEESPLAAQIRPSLPWDCCDICSSSSRGTSRTARGEAP